MVVAFATETVPSEAVEISSAVLVVSSVAASSLIKSEANNPPTAPITSVNTPTNIIGMLLDLVSSTTISFSSAILFP